VVRLFAVFLFRIFLLAAAIFAATLAHELGHFAIAIAIGYKVTAVVIGISATIAETTIGGVDFRIGVVPIGGYTQALVEELNESSALKFLLLGISGSSANILLALLATVYLAMHALFWKSNKSSARKHTFGISRVQEFREINLLVGIANFLPGLSSDGTLAWKSLAMLIPGLDLTHGIGVIIVSIFGLLLAIVILLILFYKTRKKASITDEFDQNIKTT